MAVSGSRQLHPRVLTPEAMPCLPAGKILYASKYGSTAEYARALGEFLGWDCFPVEPGVDLGEAGGPLVLGTPVYVCGVLPAMEALLLSRREDLTGRPLFGFVVCGDAVAGREGEEVEEPNLSLLGRLLPGPLLEGAVFGGRLRMAALDGDDRLMIEAFYRRLGRPPSGFDRVDTAAAAPFAARIRRRLAGGG